MKWYFYIALALILLQVLSSGQAFRNYRYAIKKYKKKRSWHKLRTVLIIPCKGLDSDFQKNITSFFQQDYESYRLWFVVADKSDPAYTELCKLRNQLSTSSKASEVKILIAGTTRLCSQKIHNLLFCYSKISNDVDALAFADSDICVRPDWLSHLVWPLRKTKNGVSSGYRWFIPKKNNLASLALSAVNAKVAQLLGNTPFNQAWGGSMAIKIDVFRRLGLEKIWSNAFSDDLSLSYAVKKAGLKIVFVPACLAASHEEITWRQLFEFGRRQFLITRVSAFGTWLFGLFCSLLSVVGLWSTIGIAIYAKFVGWDSPYLLFAVPFAIFTAQLIRAILRQKMISNLLKEDLPQMKMTIAADILAFWAWSILLLFFIISSAFGRTVRWRGIRYKLLGPAETIVMNS
jgi:cellulose synthase/poly-beta-1,6-N-acetylglucosamine synthase-like glycosyltransferase